MKQIAQYVTVLGFISLVQVSYAACPGIRCLNLPTVSQHTGIDAAQNVTSVTRFACCGAVAFPTAEEYANYLGLNVGNSADPNGNPTYTDRIDYEAYIPPPGTVINDCADGAWPQIGYRSDKVRVVWSGTVDLTKCGTYTLTATAENYEVVTQNYDRGFRTWLISSNPWSVGGADCGDVEVAVTTADSPRTFTFTVNVVEPTNLLDEAAPAAIPLFSIPITGTHTANGTTYTVSAGWTGTTTFVNLATAEGSCGAPPNTTFTLNGSGNISGSLGTGTLTGTVVDASLGLGLSIGASLSQAYTCRTNACAVSKLRFYQGLMAITFTGGSQISYPGGWFGSTVSILLTTLGWPTLNIAGKCTEFIEGCP
ncbi:MAG: hypothetical protein ACFCU1_04835 [Sumerlaeia bacterium]